MGYEQARKDIQGHFATYFTGVAADKIAWDNVEFKTPNDGSSWIRVSIQNNISNYNSFGNTRLTRRRGIVFIQIFTKEGTGTAESSQVIDNAVNVFETKLLGGVSFFSPDVKEINVNNGWCQVNISVEFWFDDITTFN